MVLNIKEPYTDGLNNIRGRGRKYLFGVRKLSAKILYKLQY